jgi:hypothetical protein
MRPGDFVFFAAYALARLVPPLSSFFLTLLEYYGLQLQHLSPNSIALVAIFIQLYEMFVGVRLFRRWWPSSSSSTRCLWGCGCWCYEPTPTTHRRLLLPTPDIGPCPLYHAYFPWQVEALERRLGDGAGEHL